MVAEGHRSYLVGSTCGPMCPKYEAVYGGHVAPVSFFDAFFKNRLERRLYIKKWEIFTRWHVLKGDMPETPRSQGSQSKPHANYS